MALGTQTPPASKPQNESPPPASESPTKETNSGQQASPTKEEPKAPASPFSKLSDVEKDRLLSVYSQTIQENNRSLNEQGSKLKELEDRVTQATQPPKPTDEQRNRSFFDQPAAAVRDLVREEINAAIAPLKDFVGTFAPRNEYDRIKETLKRDPQFAKIIGAAERHIDEAVYRSLAPGQKPTEQLVRAAALTIYGAAAAGMLADVDLNTSREETPPSPSNTSSGDNRPVYSPPHLRPSAPPPPSRDVSNPADTYEFSENELRVMRENNMSKEEFLAGMNMTGRDVVKKDAWPERKAK